MSRKTQKCYSKVFDYIQTEIFDLTAKKFMSDFELAMRNSLRIKYSQAKFETCWFHFCQAIKRYYSQHDKLFNIIRTNSTAKRIMLKFMSLPLLPAEKIYEAFVQLSAEITTINLKPEFENFLIYFENQWLKKVSSFSLFFEHLSSNFAL